MMTAVIFDMDGVIADSEYLNVKAKHIQLQMAGVNVDWHYHDKFLGTTHEFMWTEMKKEFGLKEEVPYYIDQWVEVRKKLVEEEGLKPMPGVVDLIHGLKENGFKLAVASSSLKEDIMKNMDLFGITDYFKLNLFHFKDELVAADWPVYTSTFGNINTYNAYVALVIGCCGALFIDAETKKEKIWYFICYLIASYSLITGGSDNAYLALLALFGFLPFWAFRTWKGVEKYFVMLSSFATITYIAGLIHNHMGNRVEILEGVFSVVIRSRLLVFAVAGLWLLTVILYVIEAAAKERIYKLGKLPVYIWTVLAAVIILAVGYVLYDANAGGHADKYGSVQRYVHFDDDWGTQRGMVWRLALDDYKNEFTWNEKVFGYGPETFGIMTHQWNNDETIAKTTVILR